jgi:hypothetical protein
MNASIDSPAARVNRKALIVFVSFRSPVSIPASVKNHRDPHSPDILDGLEPLL